MSYVSDLEGNLRILQDYARITQEYIERINPEKFEQWKVVSDMMQRLMQAIRFISMIPADAMFDPDRTADILNEVGKTKMRIDVTDERTEIGVLEYAILKDKDGFPDGFENRKKDKELNELILHEIIDGLEKAIEKC